MKTSPKFQILMNALHNSLLRKEIQEAIAEGFLTEEQANAIRRLNVPSGERRRRLKKHRDKMKAQYSQSAERAAKVRDLLDRANSWRGLR
jgi:hypothetical protein